ncbi:MAG: ABC transporter ATP-binding protein [Verrucomicrobia bacterium]|nr:ABC transporter ATP-binding protein [Verrucomicrobiota bacterium]
MLESRNITKKFGSKTAVDQVTLKIEPGYIYAMLGPNGSGKTTWMKMAAGLVKPTSGEMFFDGEPLSVESRQHIAYMSTEPYFYAWMTVGDVGRYYKDFFEDFSQARFSDLLRRMELTEDLKTKSLSSGMMAKLKIAVTMARDARVIMLDEPLNGIDLLAREDITRSITEAAGEDKAILVSSHLVDELETISDYAIFIKNGHLIEVDNIEESRAEAGKSIVDRYREIYGHGGQEW